MASTWVDSLPSSREAVGAFPPCAEGEPYELNGMRVTDASAGTTAVLSKPEVVNCVVQHCDVAGFIGRDGRAARIRVEQTRLRGVSWVGGILQDALFEHVQCADVSFRFSTLRRVLFRDCALPGIDLTETTLDQVRFERCELRGAQFHRAKARRLRIEHCDLTGVTGAAALTGASVHPDDLLTLGPSLAEALGLVIEE